MSCWSQKIQAGMYTSVMVCMQWPLHFQLFLKVCLKLFIDVIHNGLVTKTFTYDRQIYQLSQLLNYYSFYSLNGSWARATAYTLQLEWLKFLWTANVNESRQHTLLLCVLATVSLSKFINKSFIKQLTDYQPSSWHLIWPTIYSLWNYISKNFLQQLITSIIPKCYYILFSHTVINYNTSIMGKQGKLQVKLLHQNHINFCLVTT